MVDAVKDGGASAFTIGMQDAVTQAMGRLKKGTENGFNEINSQRYEFTCMPVIPVTSLTRPASSEHQSASISKFPRKR